MSANPLDAFDRIPPDVQAAIVTDLMDIMRILKGTITRLNPSELQALLDGLQAAGTKLGGRLITATMMGKDSSEILRLVLETAQQSAFLTCLITVVTQGVQSE